MGGLRKVCKLLISRLARILANDRVLTECTATSSRCAGKWRRGNGAS